MRFGVGHLADVLAGNDSEKVRSFGHHKLSVFGIATPDELQLLRAAARALIARDALRADAYGGLSFGPAAKPILKGEESLTIADSAATPAQKPAAFGGPARSAIRGAAGSPAADRGGGRGSALRHLPRLDPA